MREATQQQQQQQQTWGSEMSATVLSAFYDMDLLYKQDKSLNMNMNALHISSLLEQKAVGAPLSSPGSGGSFTPGFFRRNSSNTSSTSSSSASSSCCSNMEALTNGNKYHMGSYGSLKESSSIGGGGGSSSCSASTALMNKENKFRDRVTFGEGAERQLQAQQKPAAAAGAAAAASQINSTRYKTELCRPFEENGACKYGDKCQFAHGYHELRSLSRHPKYKTEPCRTFHTIGFCPYGPRCHFIHNAEERRPAPAPSAAPLANANSAAADAKAARELCSYGPREVVLQQQQQQQMRPRLQHSLSFSGFSSHYGLDSPPLLHSPTSRTPPPPTSSSSCCTSASSCSFYEDAGLSSPGTLFPFPGQDLRALLAPLAVHSGSSSYANNHSSSSCASSTAAYYGSVHQGGVCPPSPPSYNMSHLQALRGLSESPVLEPPPSPPDSLSDRESYASGSLSSSGSLSGSESPSLDAGRRLPIFSRLSISDD